MLSKKQDMALICMMGIPSSQCKKPAIAKAIHEQGIASDSSNAFAIIRELLCSGLIVEDSQTGTICFSLEGELYTMAIKKLYQKQGGLK